MGVKTLTGSGTEDTLFEDTELAEFSGHIFVDTMQAGDTVVFRVWIKDVNDTTGFPYKKWLEDTYSGVQNCKCIRLEPVIGKIGIKVTAEQTAGTNRTLNSQWFKR
jgi:hypothetical protein